MLAKNTRIKKKKIITLESWKEYYRLPSVPPNYLEHNLNLIDTPQPHPTLVL